MCNPALHSNKNLNFHSYEQIGGHPKAAVILLSANHLHDDQCSVDTPNDLSDCHDSSDDDDGYCPAAKSNFRRIHIPNIRHGDGSDSDDDNVDGNSKRLSTIDGTKRDNSDMSNIDDNEPCDNSKVRTSHACAGDTASRHFIVTDSSATGDNDACGHSKVVTSNSAPDDSSSSDDDCGYSNAVTSSTHRDDIPSRHDSDADSLDGGDEDISCYSTMITRDTIL